MQERRTVFLSNFAALGSSDRSSSYRSFACNRRLCSTSLWLEEEDKENVRKLSSRQSRAGERQSRAAKQLESEGHEDPIMLLTHLASTRQHHKQYTPHGNHSDIALFVRRPHSVDIPELPPINAVHLEHELLARRVFLRQPCCLILFCVLLLITTSMSACESEDRRSEK